MVANMTDDETKDLSEPTEEPQTAPAAVTATEAESEEKEFVFVEDPVFDVDYKGECVYEVKVAIPVANERKLSEEVFEELRHELEMPGFRKGRAPRKLIERKFAKAVRNDVGSRLVKAAFLKLVKDQDLKPTTPPVAEGFAKPEERKPDEPITFTLKFEVQPKVELGKYRGVAVERPVYQVQDADIEEAVAGIQRRFAVYETVEDGLAAEGDQVIISFKGTINGEEFSGGTAENYPYILGTKRFFPEFEQVLTGARPGQTLSCEVTFADSYSVEHLRGRTASFELKVNELKRRNVPELTDEFARQAGYGDVQDMREKLAAHLRESTEAESNEIAESRLVKTIIDSSTFEIPKSLVDSMAHEFYEETVKDLRARRVPASQIQEREEVLRAEARNEAMEAIKSWTTLNEVAEAEGIEVTEEDFEKEAAAVSQRTGVSIENVAKDLGEEEQRNRVERRLLHAKVLATIMHCAQISDKEVTHEDLDKEDETPTNG